MATLDIKKAEALEEKLDSGLHTRAIGPWLVKFTFVFSVFFADYGGLFPKFWRLWGLFPKFSAAKPPKIF